MQERGIFSFVIFLLFIEAAVLLSRADAGISQDMNETIVSLVEAEQLNFRRAEIEHGLDYVVSNTIVSEAAIRPESEWIEQRTAQNMRRYLNAVEGEGNGIKFYITEGNSGQGNEITDIGLRETFKVIVAEAEGGFLVSFFATGGLMKNKSIHGRISGESKAQEFLVPQGYAITELGVGPSSLQRQ